MAIDVSNISVFTQSNIRIQERCNPEAAHVPKLAGEASVANRARTLYFDVFQMPSEPHDADFLFITHAHYDHYSPEDALKVMNENTVVIAPAALVEQAFSSAPNQDESENAGNDSETTPITALSAQHYVGVMPGDMLNLDGIAIEVVPAYNTEAERLGFHPSKNAWVGYVVTLDGVRYYIAGDTDQNPDNSQVVCDVMLVPVGGTFTCNPAQAAAFVNAVKPQVAIPTHYGSIVGNVSDGDAFAALVNPEISVVKKLFM